MKSMMKTLGLIAAAAMGLTACQNDFEEQIEAKESVVVKFVAEEAVGRTSVDTTGEAPVFAWGNEETFVVLEQTDKLTPATAVSYEKNSQDGTAEITATFDSYVGQSEYKYVTVYPQGGYVKAESIESATLNLPAEQTMSAEGTYDPNADLMVSKVVTTTAQPTEAQLLQFARLAAVAQMKIVGIESGDNIKSVIFSAEDKALAGNLTADLTSPHTTAVAAAEGSNSVTVAVADGVAGDVFFTLLPTSIAAGESYTVTVITEKNIYIKEGTIPEGKELRFEAGMVTRFGVSLEGASVSDKWVLVKDVNELSTGDVVTFAAKSYNYVMGNWGSNYAYASYTEAVKMGDMLFHPVATEDTKANYRIQHLVVVQRDQNKAAFDFYNGKDYDNDNYVGYIRPHSTNNYLRVNENPSVNTLFYTTIAEDGTATLVAEDSEYKYKNLKYYKYGNTTSGRRFVATSSTSSSYDDLCIYKIAGGVKGEVPVADADIEVPSKDVVIGKEAAIGATFEDVVFNYVGDWTITAKSNEEWLTVSYANETLTYGVVANTAVGIRKAEVTITASLAGKSDLSWKFNVIQKGEPEAVSIEDFNDKPKDANLEYRVTGILTTKASYGSSNTTLSDAEGNKANFRYIDMADSSSFYENETIKEGDVVTIVAAKAYSASYGGSSDAHSICEGYYNIAATAPADIVAYGGGQVTISIAKVGTLTPGTITGSVDQLFAELTYTENATTATVKLAANDGAPRQVVVTFTDGVATTSATIIQAADTRKGLTWERVTDASTLKVTDQVMIVAKNYDVAMGTTISDNTNNRNAVAITKLGDKFITPATGAQSFVLGKSDIAGTFSFYDNINKGFLVSTNATSYYLENQPYVDENAAFAITIAEDGTATIGNVAGTYADNNIYYHPTNDYFYSGTSAKDELYLYRRVGVKGRIPVVEPNITINEPVIPAEGGSGILEDVVFNYVGNWTILVSDDAAWLTVAYDKENKCLTYTAQENTGEARVATVTITSVQLDHVNSTQSFTLTQKGFAPKMTIAEFLAIPVEERNDNVYSRYTLTGRITEAEDIFKSPAVFTIEDESGSIVVKGLIVEDSDKDAGDLGLKVGDVVTLTTPRFANNSQGNEVNTAGNGSNKEAFYLSHYNISASATAAEYTAGSTATINITSTSGMDVVCEMAESDFATLSYTTTPAEENTVATVTFNSDNTAEVAREVVVTISTGLATTTVTVVQEIDPSKVKGWTLVTDASTLAEGDEIIIVAKNSDKALACLKSTSNATTVSNFPSVEIVKSGNTIDIEGTDVLTFKVVAGADEGTLAFVFAHKTSEYYLSTYGSTGLKGRASLSSATESYTVSIAEDGNATLSSKRDVKFNSSASQTFTSYASTASNATKEANQICIYKNFK